MTAFRRENNFRDIGGCKTQDGFTVRKGVFYRSAALCNMNDQEMAYLQKLGLKTVFDFRSRLEEAALPDPPIDGATNYHISALRDIEGNDVDYSSLDMILMALKEPGLNKMNSLMKHLYRYIAFDCEAYRKMFELILSERTPILFHCTQGKDRTGIAAILILLALGVDEETILDDYMLTNRYRRKLIRENMNRHKILTRISVNSKEFFWMKEGVDRSFGRAVFEGIKENYPDYETFFRTEYDLSNEDLQHMREMYLEKI